MLAMPNAAGHRPLGDLFAMRVGAAGLRTAMPSVRTAGPVKHAALGRCLQKPPPWQRLVTVNDYRPPLSGLIHQLKFNKRPELAPALARLLLLRIRHSPDLPHPDRIISVPLWQRRQWRRGFNQSDLLCRPLSRWLGCAWRSDALTRRRRTATQHQLSARLRKQNLKNAFQLELSLQGHHIAIVDDVVTTGSTVAEISRLLLRNGAATVQVWCICRTL